jgi:hypothetical protein
MSVVHAPFKAQIPPLQPPVAQSDGTWHFLPTPHVAHVPPPQSVSVSLPSCMPSKQVLTAAEQAPPMQKPLQQLALVMHAVPLGAHMFIVGEQTPFAQLPLQHSAFVMHIVPSGPHIVAVEHTPPEQIDEQHSADWTQTPPLAVQVGSFGKSIPTAT